MWNAHRRLLESNNETVRSLSGFLWNASNRPLTGEVRRAESMPDVHDTAAAGTAISISTQRTEGFFRNRLSWQKQEANRLDFGFLQTARETPSSC